MLLVALIDAPVSVVYTIEGLEGEHRRRALGRDLMAEGLAFDDLAEED
jgi:hypothetical protein